MEQIPNQQICNSLEAYQTDGPELMVATAKLTDFNNHGYVCLLSSDSKALQRSRIIQQHNKF